jgi:putative NADH-flavin reductase
MAQGRSVAIVGASGWLGGLVVREAVRREHRTTAIIRNPARSAELPPEVSVKVADARDGVGLSEALRDRDAVVSAYRAPQDAPEDTVLVARALMEAAREAGVRRLVWTGTTGSLRIPGGGFVVDLPSFPADRKQSALAQRDALELFQKEGSQLDWTYVCPPQSFGPGVRTGSYHLLVEEIEGQGEHLTAEDFAVAVVDLAESDLHYHQCVGVAFGSVALA